MLELAGKGALFETLNTKGDVSRFFVRKTLIVRSDHPTGRLARLVGDEPTRIYVPILLRPLVMQRGHVDVTFHFGVSHTLRMLERFYWSIGMEECVRW